MTDYRPIVANYVSNLATFYRSLDDTSIHFLFFPAGLFKETGAASGTEAYIKDTFKRLKLKSGKAVYIMHGKLSNKGIASYFYLYQANKLEWLVKPSITQESAPKDATKVDIYSRYPPREQPYPMPKPANVLIEAYHGDHLDFGVLPSRDGVVVKIHRTCYTDLMGDWTSFSRDVRECNFIFTEAMLKGEELLNANCDPDAKILLRQRCKDTIDQECIQKLCDVMVNGARAGGQVKQYVKYKGRKHLVRQGAKGGRFVVHKGKKAYLKSTKKKGQKGGVSLLTPQVEKFIATRIYNKVAAAIDGLEYMTVLFDDHDPKAHFVLMYDFVDATRNIFYIDAVLVFDASFVAETKEKQHVDLRLDKPEFQDYELKVQHYNIFNSILSGMIAQMVMVA